MESQEIDIYQSENCGNNENCYTSADNEIGKGEWAVGSFRGSAWMKNRERVAWRRRQATRRKKRAGKNCELPGGGHRPRLIDYRNEYAGFSFGDCGGELD